MTVKTVYLQERDQVLQLTYEDKTYSFKLKLGFKYLLELLRNPGKRYYAMSFYNALNPVPEEYRFLAEISDKERNQSYLYSFDDLPTIYKADWQTVREVGARLNFLLAQKALYMEYNDIAALDEVENEIEYLTRYLNDVMNKNGKLSAFLSSEKKVVQAVNKATRRAIQEVANDLPDLAAYLEKQVYAWHVLYYMPGGDYRIVFY